MAAFITAPVFADRILGKSESAKLPNRAVLLLTGNNMTLAGDMPRRVIICRVDPGTDQPFARQFALDPLRYVIDNRGRLIAAACILIRAAKIHATNRAPGRMASFEDWDDMVRQAVCWINDAVAPGEFGDVMDLVKDAQASDPEADSLLGLLEALHHRFGAGQFSARDVLDAANGDLYGGISEALSDLAGKPVTSAKGIGKLMKYRVDRIVSGMRLRAWTIQGTTRYRVEIVAAAAA